MNWKAKPIKSVNLFIDERTVSLDNVLEKVIRKYSERAAAGKKKYGTNLNRQDLLTVEWIEHLQEELMDATLYLEKLKMELNEKAGQ